MRALTWDIVGRPDLALQDGRLPVLDGPGLGFELNWEAVREAAEAWWKGADGGRRHARSRPLVRSPANLADPQHVDDDAPDRGSDGDDAPPSADDRPQRAPRD